jgi:opacity protein-like surface antigen
LNNKIKAAAKIILLSLLLHGYEAHAQANNCQPCGEFITNLPMPGYDSNPVQPFQNYVATYQGCMACGWNGFYVGTGVGYGVVNLNLTIPGISLPTQNDSYITEYATIGYAHSSGRFFIATELGYYYRSVTSPLFYDDPSSIMIETTLVTPSTVRLDINAKNHVALDLLPGFVFSPSLTVYGRLGLEYTNYSWVRRVGFPAPSLLVPIVPNEFSATAEHEIEDDESAAIIGLRLGVGASYAVGRHLSFNLNYIHITGSRGSMTPNASLITSNVLSEILTPITTLIENLDTLAVQNRIKPTSNEVLLGVTLTF